MSSQIRRPLLTIRSAQSIRSVQTAPVEQLTLWPETNELVRFAGPCHTDLNSKMYLRLAISAQHSLANYKEYDYFGVHTRGQLKQKSTSWGSVIRLKAAQDWLCRDRRCVAFVDASGLTPVAWTPQDEEQTELLNTCVHTDHLTYWISSSGAKFLLNEPYGFDDDYQQRLKKKGFVGFRLPINISPYCGGGWTIDPSTSPHSRSFLITRAESTHELEEIEQKLIEADKYLPAWNDVSEIHYV
jgi:hypothetical protein